MHYIFRKCFNRSEFAGHLLELWGATVSTLHQVGGLLADAACHLTPIAFNEGLGIISLHGLQDTRQHEHAALQTVVCTLDEAKTQSIMKSKPIWGLL